MNNTRAKQGGSAVVYGIVSVLLALGVVGAVYAVHQRANGEQIAPMDIAAIDPSQEKEKTEQAANEKAALNTESTDKEQAAKEQAAKEQAAEEKKAQEQREAAAAEARKQQAEQKKASEQKEQQPAEQKPAAGNTTAPAQPNGAQQMPTAGGPGTDTLPQTGPADLVLGAFVLLVLGYTVVKYSFSHKFVTGK